MDLEYTESGWSRLALKALCEDIPPEVRVRTPAARQPGENLRLRVVIKDWDQRCRRAWVGTELPDIYGAMMAPLRECPQFLGTEGASYIIAHRLAGEGPSDESLARTEEGRRKAWASPQGSSTSSSPS